MGDKKAYGFGITSLISLLSPALGIVIGGFVLEYGSWRWLFFGPLLPGSIAIILSFKLIPRDKIPVQLTKLKQFDYAGTFTLAIATFSFLFAVNRGPVYGWKSWVVLTCFGLILPFLGLFAFAEKRAKIPILPSFFFQSKIVLLATAARGVFWLVYAG